MRHTPLGLDKIAGSKIEGDGFSIDRVRGSGSLANPIRRDSRQGIPLSFTLRHDREGVDELAVDFANFIWKIDLRLEARQLFLLLKLLAPCGGLLSTSLDSRIAAREDSPQEPALLPRCSFLLE